MLLNFPAMTMLDALIPEGNVSFVLNTSETFVAVSVGSGRDKFVKRLFTKKSGTKI